MSTSNSKKIAFFISHGKNIGNGHLSRCTQLCNVLASRGHCPSIILEDEDATIENHYIQNMQRDFDIIVHDSNHDLSHFFSNSCPYKIGLDYSGNYQNEFHSLIFLYDHNPKLRQSFTGHKFEGIEFAIINKNVKKLSEYIKKKCFHKLSIAIGGYSTVSLLKSTLQKINVDLFDTITLYSLNREILTLENDFKGITFMIGKSLDENFFNASHIICNAGTTVLESLYLGHKPFVVPQTEHERNFSNYLVHSDYCYHFETQYSKLSHEFPLISPPLLDGLGDERICNIILGNF
ncbi:MAG: hypothetical protein H6622_12880 [Halobacteriovoraceae bacterium]|nr:hypothetical protein [Halobacteriovoraceae bacterium]